MLLGQGNEGTFEYKDLPRPGSSNHYDRAAEAAFCVGGDGGLVSYEYVKVNMSSSLVVMSLAGKLLFKLMIVLHVQHICGKRPCVYLCL